MINQLIEILFFSVNLFWYLQKSKGRHSEKISKLSVWLKTPQLLSNIKSLMWGKL